MKSYQRHWGTLLLAAALLMGCGGGSPTTENFETESESTAAVTTVEEPAGESATDSATDSATPGTTDVAEVPTDASPTEATSETEGASEVREVPTLGPNAVTTDSGLSLEDKTVGSGEEAQAGQLATVHYTGWLENGTQFDSSVDRGEPFQFPLGQGGVIPGWDEGVQGMQVGGTRVLVIPPELGYGEAGAGGVIPANATLVFQVELLGLEDLPEIPEAPAEVESYMTTDSGLEYATLEPGEGAAAESGSLVSVNYTGWLEDGTMFDSSLTRGQPIQFVLGQGQVIPGWDEGVTGMLVGERRQLRIPADLAYGERGAGGVIPPNATLIFDVELVDVQAP